MKKQIKLFTRIVMFLMLVIIMGTFFNKNQIISAQTIKESPSTKNSLKMLNEEKEEDNYSITPETISVDDKGKSIESKDISVDKLPIDTRAIDPVWGSWGNWQKNYTYSTSVVSARGITSLGYNTYRANLHWKVSMRQGDTHATIPLNYGAFGLYANRTTSVTPRGYTATGDNQRFVDSPYPTSNILPQSGTGYAQVKTWYEGSTLTGGPNFYFLSDVKNFAFYSPVSDGINHTLDLDVNFDYTTTDPKGYTSKNQQNIVTYYYPSAPWEPQLIKAKHIDMDTGVDIGQGMETKGYNGYLYDECIFSAKDIPNYTYQYRVESDNEGASTAIKDSTNKISKKTLNLKKQGIVFYYKKEKKSSVSVNKYDATDRNTKLANASIQLYDSNKILLDTKITTGTTDINFGNLSLGTYYLKETTAPSGYGIDNPNFVQINLTESGASYNFYDSKLKNSIVVNKYDATDRTIKLANTTIQLYDSNKKLLDTKITDGKNAINFSNLTLGMYYLKETTAPSGYGIDNPNFVQINLTESGVSYSFYDSKLKNSIVVNKYDATDRTIKLANATIQLYDSNKKLLDTKTTDGKNAINFSNLTLGTYYLKETTAPSGYGIDNPNFVQVNLTNSGASYNFYDTKLKIESTISVNKYDKDNRTQRLSGAGIQLCDANKNHIVSYFSSDTKPTEFKNLAPGTYYLKEIFAPDGYEIDNPNFVQIILTESGASYNFYDTKLKIESTILVNKYDKDNRTQRLSGAGIQLYDANKNPIVSYFSSDTKPTEFKNLAPGTYYLKEIFAPDGYEIDNPEYVAITLTKSGASYNFYDTKMKSSISVNKYDKDDKNKRLSDAVIELSDVNKKPIVSYFTSDKEKIEFKNLNLGTYYLREIAPPDGYTIDNSDYVPITLTESGASYDFYDTKVKSSISVNKYDANDKGMKLANATIQLYNNNKTLLDTKITDGKNDLLFENLTLGTYYLKETTAPAGYRIDDPNYVTITLTESGANYNFFDSELPGDIVVTKLDFEDNNKVLEGAQITLYDETKKEVTSGETNTKGEVTFSGIKKGSYYLKETKAPNGYGIDNSEFVSIMVDAGKVTKYSFYDTKLIEEVKLNIRQVVLAPNGELVIPTTGYFVGEETQADGLNRNKKYGLDSSSDKEKLAIEVTASDFTMYKIKLSSGYDFIKLSTITPEYYNVVGYQATKNQSTISKDHVSTQPIVRPTNSLPGNVLLDIRLDYSKETEYFITVYIEPNQYVKPDSGKNKSPAYHNWDYNKNKFNYIK